MAIHGYDTGNPVLRYSKALGLETKLLPASSGTLFTKDGPIDSNLATKIRGNLNAAMSHMNNVVSQSSSSDTSPVADILLSPSSQLYAGLSESDKPKATALARALEIGWGIPLEEAAAHWSGWASGVAFAGSDGIIVGGYGKLAASLRSAAESTGKATFTLSSRISKVTLIDDTIECRTSDGTTFLGRATLSTIPLGTLKMLPQDFFDPPLPVRKVSAVSRAAVGVLEKLGLLYDSSWWDHAAGPFTILLESGTVLAFPISSSPPCLHVLVPHGLVGLPAHEIHDILAQAIAPGKIVPQPSKVLSSNWKNDDLSYGATSSPIKVGEGRSPLDFAEVARPAWSGLLGF
ncbi:hypothetical protein BT96DRAFT_984328 [Gymnopus androsaceus JB14]|uniref:Amine oxidase domain-containing protein n=1 Tax=Gymnopus androsaceus JB14 TaxID=1447944 RepID=A0A6A4IK98_9AGAR|nr:hypothetical protein BT96DRAFT_984328 [Gymnopus androsaceus JB14]